MLKKISKKMSLIFNRKEDIKMRQDEIVLVKSRRRVSTSSRELNSHDFATALGFNANNIYRESIVIANPLSILDPMTFSPLESCSNDNTLDNSLDSSNVSSCIIPLSSEPTLNDTTDCLSDSNLQDQSSSGFKKNSRFTVTRNEVSIKKKMKRVFTVVSKSPKPEPKPKPDLFYSSTHPPRHCKIPKSRDRSSLNRSWLYSLWNDKEPIIEAKLIQKIEPEVDHSSNTANDIKVEPDSYFKKHNHDLPCLLDECADNSVTITSKRGRRFLLERIVSGTEVEQGRFIVRKHNITDAAV